MSDPKWAASGGKIPRYFGIDPSGQLAVLTMIVGDGRVRPSGSTDEIESFFTRRGLPAVVATGSQDTVTVIPWNGAISELVELAGESPRVARGRTGGRDRHLALLELELGRLVERDRDDPLAEAIQADDHRAPHRATVRCSVTTRNELEAQLRAATHAESDALGWRFHPG